MPQMKVRQSGSSPSSRMVGGNTIIQTRAVDTNGLLNRIENSIAARMHDPPP